MLDLDNNDKLEKILALTEENNKILRNIRSKGRWSTFFSVLKWIAFVGVTIGSYYFIQPYIDQTLSIYNSLQKTQSQSNGVYDYVKNLGDSLQKTLPR